MKMPKIFGVGDILGGVGGAYDYGQLSQALTLIRFRHQELLERLRGATGKDRADAQQFLQSGLQFLEEKMWMNPEQLATLLPHLDEIKSTFGI